MAPWGIFTLYLRSTYGLRWVYPRSTLGLRWVISLAISGRFLLIFAESLTKRRARKFFLDKMDDFLMRKRHFWGRVQLERSGSPREKNKRIPNVLTEFSCSYVHQIFMKSIFSEFRRDSEISKRFVLRLFKRLPHFRKLHQTLLNSCVTC